MELKTSLDRSAQFYGKMKAEKEMADQVVVIELTLGNMDGDNDPPPPNVEICHFDKSCCRCCRRIVLPKNPSSRRCRVLPSDNPSEAVDCCVSTSEEIFRSMPLKIVIRPRPSRSGLGVIKVQEEKRKMKTWIIYNVVAMLFHWKLDRMKTPPPKRDKRQQYILSFMTMECNISRDFLKSQSGGKHTSLHSPLDLLIPLARKRYLAVY